MAHESTSRGGGTAAGSTEKESKQTENNQQYLTMRVQSRYELKASNDAHQL